MWQMYQQATAWTQRPSSLIGIEDEWAAYQFDYAVLEFGRWVEQGLADIKPLSDLLETPEKRGPRRFASLKARAKGKRKS